MRKFWRSVIGDRKSAIGSRRPDGPIPTSVLRPPTSVLRPPASGVTLLELLAVLTVISISLMIVVGAYGSWGTAHALSGATRILEAGLQQARSLAVSQNAYVAFDYGSYVTNDVQTMTYFQIFLCTNESEVVAAVLQQAAAGTALDLSDDTFGATPAAPFQRLSGHVSLGSITETDMTSGSSRVVEGTPLFFRPDGSAWSWDDVRAHYLCVQTRERFAMRATKLDNTDDPKPLKRLLRIDLATGLVTVIKGEAQP